jgi:hypothetical protein
LLFKRFLDRLNDGQWHEITLLLTQYRFNITVDFKPEFSFTRNNLSTTDRFTFSSNGDLYIIVKQL